MLKIRHQDHAPKNLMCSYTYTADIQDKKPAPKLPKAQAHPASKPVIAEPKKPKTVEQKCADLFVDGKDLNKSINLEPEAAIQEVEPSQKIMIGASPTDSKVLIQEQPNNIIEDDKDKSMALSHNQHQIPQTFAPQ